MVTIKSNLKKKKRRGQFTKTLDPFGEWQELEE